jgi:Na+-driven multidrug efflux pump
MTIFAYWVVAFPLAFFTAVVWRLDPHLVWGGFVAGLCVAGALLTGRFWVLSRSHAQ